MQKLFIIALFALYSTISFAHKPHSHSSGTINLAFEGLNGEFELELPAAVILDFEHRPKNSIQKLKLQKAIENLKDSISQILIIEPSNNCKVSNTLSEVIYSDKNETHSEFKLSAHVQCTKPPTLQSIRIPILHLYPKLNKIEVQTIMGDLQNSFILKGTQDQLN